MFTSVSFEIKRTSNLKIFDLQEFVDFAKRILSHFFTFLRDHGKMVAEVAEI